MGAAETGNKAIECRVTEGEKGDVRS
jgi:hypothetical protein